MNSVNPVGKMSMPAPALARMESTAASPPIPEESKKRPRSNPWLDHVKDFRAKHPDMKFKDVLVLAKSSYTKVAK